MAELRKHREISEIIFGLGLNGVIDWQDIDVNMLVYPYNVAAQDRVDNPDEWTVAALMMRYGADAIKAAEHAAGAVHNGVPPKDWVDQLVRTYKNYKVVNVMHRVRKKIEQDEEADFEALRDVLDKELEVNQEPVSWADIKDEFKQEWLWPGWVPHGELTILVGKQGAGKSAFALFFADCVANGKPLPDGSVIPETMGVLWVETEGRFAENVRRARAWDVDPQNILSPAQDFRTVIDLTRPEHKMLIRAQASREDIGLIVIDSLGGSLMDENDASAKRILHELSRMAQETDTTMLVIHHLRKKNPNAKGHQRITLEDVRGHSGITQFAPSVMAIDYEGNEMPRFLIPLKMNLVKEPPTMTFQMGTYGLNWNEATSDQVLRQAVQDTVVWLEDLLAAGPMTIKEVKEFAEEAGREWDFVKQAIDFPSIQVIENTNGERCLSL